MRILIAGGGDVGRITAEKLVASGNDVILIDTERETCERIATELDLMVICGDATKPDILEKAGIENADLVMALSGNDQMNLITALVARSYDVKRVMVNLDDPAFNIVCQKLGVEEIVNPKSATAKHLADMAKMPHALDVSTIIGGSIRVFTAIIHKDRFAGKHLSEVDLPHGSIAVAVKRENEFFIPGPEFKLLEGDHITILAEERLLEELAGVFEEITTPPLASAHVR